MAKDCRVCGQDGRGNAEVATKCVEILRMVGVLVEGRGTEAETMVAKA
jgi:hypothetical protein